MKIATQRGGYFHSERGFVQRTAETPWERFTGRMAQRSGPRAHVPSPIAWNAGHAWDRLARGARSWRQAPRRTSVLAPSVNELRANFSALVRLAMHIDVELAGLVGGILLIGQLGTRGN